MALKDDLQASQGHGAIAPHGRPASPLLVALLGLIAAGVWLRPAQVSSLPEALAQLPTGASSRNIQAFSGPMGRGEHGVFMLDLDQGTLWCYAIDVVDGVRKLRLVAARSWVYDRYLQDYNSTGPTFRDVQNLVSQERDARGVGELRPARPVDPGPP